MRNWVVAAVVMLAGLAGAITAFLHVSVDEHVVAVDAAMSQLIQPKDRLTVQNVPEVHRGDVVVFSSRAWPAAREKGELVERVIGVGGDVITAGAGNLTVNGRPVAEDYVYKDGTADRFADFTVTVPQGTVYLAGDWRANSADSRMYGDRGGIPTTDVMGVVTEVNGQVLTPTKVFTNAGLFGPAGAGEPVMWPPIVAPIGLAAFASGLVWLVLALARRFR